MERLQLGEGQVQDADRGAAAFDGAKKAPGSDAGCQRQGQPRVFLFEGHGVWKRGACRCHRANPRARRRHAQLFDIFMNLPGAYVPLFGRVKITDGPISNWARRKMGDRDEL